MGLHNIAWLLWSTALSVMLIPNGAKSRILRLPCTQFANFTILKKGHVLLTAKLHVRHDVSSQDCKAACVFNQKCKAVSHHVNGTCILHRKSPSDPESRIFEGSLTSETGWTFMSTDYSEKLNGQYCHKYNPCKDRFCVDTCHCPGYQCVRCGHGSDFQCPDGHLFLMQNGFRCLKHDVTFNHFYRSHVCHDKFFFSTGSYGLYVRVNRRSGSTRACLGLNSGFMWLEAKKCGSLDTLWIRDKSNVLWNAATQNCLYNHLPVVYTSSNNRVSACHSNNNQFRLLWD